MALSFVTKPQEMVFVNAVTHHVQSAWSLTPGTLYNVYFVIGNDADFEELGVAVHVTHSAFGIGLPGGTSQIPFQPAPVTVPPAGPGGLGQATCVFGYLTPAGGHSCLLATIQPAGPSLSQNTTILSVPIGVVSTVSFLVFNPHPAPAVMSLTLAETLASGAPLPPVASWQPRFMPPAGIGPAGPVPAPVNLNLPPDSFYSVGLRLAVPVGAPSQHLFHVTGFVAGANVGEVELRVGSEVPEALPAPAPYVRGGYQSPDIVLFHPVTGVPVPLGGVPGGSWDTTLLPNEDYGFAAWVHNSSPAIARNTVVRFWSFTGGVGSAGILVDCETADIPAWGSVVIRSAHPFHTPAGHGAHQCAAVSIYNALAGTCPDAVMPAQVPDPCLNPAHSCSAWRNTTTVSWVLGEPFHIDLLAAYPLAIEAPILIDVEALHVPVTWFRLEEVQAALKAVEQEVNVPPYMLPQLAKTLKPIDLALKFEAPDYLKPEPSERMGPGIAFRIVQAGEKQGEFRITGWLPPEVEAGDVILVRVSAHYDKTRFGPPRTVDYLHVAHITKQ